VNYKLIALDLDGTLLTDDKKITRDNIDVIRAVNSIGVEIIVATGRRYFSAKGLVKDLAIDLIIMANNGNMVRRMSDNKLLVTKYLSKDDFYRLIKIGRKKGLYPIVHADHFDEGYDILIELDKDDERYYSYLSKIGDRYRNINNLLDYKNPRVLVTCYLGEEKDLKTFQEEIMSTLPGRYNSHIMRQTRIGSILEFMNPLGTKWFSIKEYAHTKGIKTKEIIAIGDDNNDIEMIKNSGLGIAMKNGTKEVKGVADLITSKTNNESGVAVVLKRIFEI
jgi:hypothetical protein